MTTLVSSPGRCPWCRQLQDRLTPINEDLGPPRSGDMAFCVSCQGLMVFDRNLKRRKPTISEIRIAAEIVTQLAVQR